MAALRSCGKQFLSAVLIIRDLQSGGVYSIDTCRGRIPCIGVERPANFRKLSMPDAEFLHLLFRYQQRLLQHAIRLQKQGSRIMLPAANLVQALLLRDCKRG